MIKRNAEHKIDIMENMFGEAGKVEMLRLIETPEELYGKGRVFSLVTLRKDCGLGYHVHRGDCEYYHILSGEGLYSDNGELCTLKVGDTAFCPAGEGHSIKNLGEEPLVFIALIIYE